MVRTMTDSARPTRPFNSPLECGLRLLFVLDAADGAPLDLQRLVSYDYLLVHSGDVAGGPRSLHPPVPFRGTELLVKRDLVQLGLNQMFARELLLKQFDTYGISYRSTQHTGAFLTLMQTDYADALRERAAWLVASFQGYDNRALQTYMTENIGRWGAEFDHLTAINALEL
jgi:hypothetical protein